MFIMSETSGSKFVFLVLEFRDSVGHAEEEREVSRTAVSLGIG